MKKTVIILIVLIVIIAMLVALRGLIAKNLLVSGIKYLTGLEMEIDSASIGIRRAFVDLKGLKLFNPSSFGERIMADIPRIYVEYDLKEFLSNRIHLPVLKIDIQEVNVERRPKEGLNMNTLQALLPRKDPGGKSPAVNIDLLTLKLGTIKYIDRLMAMPVSKKFTLNIEASMRDITDAKALVSFIVGKVFEGAGLTDELKKLEEAKQKVIDSSAQVKQKVVQTAGEVKDTAQESMQQIQKDTKEALDKARGELRQLLNITE